MADRPPLLHLTVQADSAAGECPADRRQLRRWVLAALERDATITLRLVGIDEGRALNSTFRGKDYATNVLTFDYDDPPAMSANGSAARPRERSRAALPPVTADVVICLPVVIEEALRQRKALRDHLGHLVIHGVLHAQGLDHEDDDAASRMEARETRILRRFGIPDPYRAQTVAA